MNKQAFTLIELLVVVLIIGILASVALPQYKRAVLSARMTEAIAVIPTLANAHYLYWLSNGTHTTDLTLLDVEIPNNRTTTTWLGTNSEDPNHYYFSCATANFCGANAANPDLPIITKSKNSEQLECLVNSSKTTTAENLCKSKGTYRQQAYGYTYYILY